jgi:hypothetical protein
MSTYSDEICKLHVLFESMYKCWALPATHGCSFHKLEHINHAKKDILTLNILYISSLNETYKQTLDLVIHLERNSKSLDSFSNSKLFVCYEF